MSSEEPSTVTDETTTPVDGDDSGNLSKNALKKKLKAEKAAAAKVAKAQAKVRRQARRNEDGKWFQQQIFFQCPV